MTEQEWLTAWNVWGMIAFLRARHSEPHRCPAGAREIRLFACGCCHLVQHLVREEQFHQALLAAEQFADGNISEEELETAASWASFSSDEYEIGPEKYASQAMVFAAGNGGGTWAWDTWTQVYLAMEAEELVATTVPALLEDTLFRWEREHVDLYDGQPDCDDPAQLVKIADLLRCMIGNPFRPVAFDPAWRTEAAVGIAAKMYDERDFRAMPILADALEEAGCDNADVLAHCREPGPHARGCWVVDGVLGKR